jgi:glycosyltransferase involved in cell wall biosynthesis
MKIVFISAWYSENMGYIENCLPKSLARLGHEVHVITSTAQVYFNHPFYEKAYQKYLGDPIQPEGIRLVDGVQVHRLPFQGLKKKIILRGVFKTLKTIRPDIVHTFEHVAIDTLKLVFFKMRLGFKLFTSNHAVYSVYPIARNWQNLTIANKLEWLITEYLPGRFTNLFIEKCFAVTVDAGEIASKYRGVSPNKVKIATLGVDTLSFHPNSSEKQAFRQKWGFQEDAIICLYSGKLIAQKQPVLIAQAIDALSKKGLNIKGFFIAEGELADEIRQYPSSQIIPLQPFKELPNFFRMADIAIWPGEESSSQLDAVASGACLVLTDNIQAYDEIGLNDEKLMRVDTPSVYKPKIVSKKFKHGDLTDLIEKLSYLSNKNIRTELSQKGVSEIQDKYSWDIIARNRLEDYML